MVGWEGEVVADVLYGGAAALGLYLQKGYSVLEVGEVERMCEREKYSGGEVETGSGAEGGELLLSKNKLKLLKSM